MTDRVKVASTVTQTDKAVLVDCSTQTDPTEAVKVVAPGAAAAANAANVVASAQSAALITSKASTLADAPPADPGDWRGSDRHTRCGYCSFQQKLERRGLTRCGRCRAYI